MAGEKMQRRHVTGHVARCRKSKKYLNWLHFHFTECACLVVDLKNMLMNHDQTPHDGVSQEKAIFGEANKMEYSKYPITKLMTKRGLNNFIFVSA